MRKKKPLKVIDISGMKSVYRSYRLVPYEEIEEIIENGGTAFVEGINRKTAWSAARTLSKKLGKTVKAKKRYVILKEEEEYIEAAEGYLFECEES